MGEAVRSVCALEAIKRTSTPHGALPNSLNPGQLSPPKSEGSISCSAEPKLFSAKGVNLPTVNLSPTSQILSINVKGCHCLLRTVVTRVEFQVCSAACDVSLRRMKKRGGGRIVGKRLLTFNMFPPRWNDMCACDKPCVAAVQCKVWFSMPV